MSRTALLLLVVSLAAGAPGFAQFPTGAIDSLRRVPPLLPDVTPCDPTGNVDEVPFEPTSVPLEDWLKERKASQISMNLNVSPPELRMDQQTAVSYQASISLKNPKLVAQERKVVFFVGVDSADGKRLTEPSTHAANIPEHIQGSFDVGVNGCVFFRPGSYSLWVAAYDESTGKHGVQRRNIRVSELKNDPLPLLESQMPPARFPDFTPEDAEIDKVLPSALLLPVSNKRPLDIDIVSLSPFQRSGIGPLTQMALKDSSVSVVTLDLQTQKVVYDSRVTGTFDFIEMLKAAEKYRQDQTIDFNVLLTRDDREGFLRKFLEARIKSTDGKARVTFVLSSPVDFRRGADTSPIRFDENCDCRLYYLQMFPYGSDDLRKILTSTQSRRLEINSAMELRKALATIMRDLEEF